MIFKSNLFDKLFSIFSSYRSLKLAFSQDILTDNLNIYLKNINTRESKRKKLSKRLSLKTKNYLIVLGLIFIITCLALLAFRAMANRIIFQGAYEDIDYDINNISSGEIKIPKFDNEYLEPYLKRDSYYDTIRKFIEIDDLKGCSYTFKYPKSNELKNKCVIVFGPNSTSVQWISTSLTMTKLLNKGAAVVAVDYRGYGYSKLESAALTISQRTLYNDGEKVYNYVFNNLKYDPKNILVFGFSLGGSVASHVASYADERKHTLGGLILASPINSLYNVSSDQTCKILAMLVRAATMSELDTEKNLRIMSNKNLPLFLCSGDDQDFLSLKTTLLDQKVRKYGSKNVQSNIQNMCGHNYLDRMFKGKSFDTYINSNFSYSNMDIDQ